MTARFQLGILAAWAGLTSCGAPAPGEDVGTSSLPLERAIWTSVSPRAPETTRAHHLFVYDEARQTFVVFGGRPPSDSGASLADTGTWSESTWVGASSALGRRGYVAGAYDSARERTVMYGGVDVVSSEPVRFDDTWEFDGTGWSQRDTAGPPGKRSSYGLAYDRQRAVTVLFGGYDGAWKGDVWEWDGTTWSARCSATPCSTAARPKARANPVFVYDQARKVTVLFGGFGNGSSFADTWTWDGEFWTERSPAHAPSGRDSAAATYDPVGQRVLLFGGVQQGDRESNELWAWDGTDWTSISTAATLAARQGAGFAWDVLRARGVLFGGSALRTSTGVWELSVVENGCSAPQDCPSGSCVSGLCSSEGGSSAGGVAGATVGGPSSGSTSTSGGGSTSAGVTLGGSGGTSGGDESSNQAPSGGEPSPASEGGAPPRVDRNAAGEPTQADTPEGLETRSFYSCAVAPLRPKRGGERFALGGLLATLAWSWLRRANRLSRRA